jgi:hypothetical protein
MKPNTPQGLLDAAAMATSPVPFVGDAVGLLADSSRFVNEPESRTPLNFGLAALGLIPFVPPLVSAGLGKFAQSQGKTLGQLPTGPARNQAGAIVYHGSPHKFDQFDSSKIGTGEGAQAYGHGLYFAENPSVAGSYKKPEVLDVKRTKDGVTAKLNTGEVLGPYKTTAEIDQLINQRGGSLYKVDLPDEAIAKMLDYDAPLSKQPEAVKNALLGARETTAFVNKANDFGKKFNSSIDVNDLTGAKILNFLGSQKSNTYGLGSEKDAAAYLNKLGIPGIRYLDGGSRGAGQGTSNYVVFPGNEGLLKILSRE